MVRGGGHRGKLSALQKAKWPLTGVGRFAWIEPAANYSLSTTGDVTNRVNNAINVFFVKPPSTGKAQIFSVELIYVRQSVRSVGKG